MEAVLKTVKLKGFIGSNPIVCVIVGVCNMRFEVHHKYIYEDCIIYISKNSHKEGKKNA